MAMEVEMAAMATTTTTTASAATSASRSRWPNHDGSAPDADAIVFGDPTGIGSIVSVTSVVGTPYEKKARRAGRGATAFVFAIVGAIVGLALQVMATDTRGSLYDALRDVGLTNDSEKLVLFVGGSIVLFAVVAALVHRASLHCTWVGAEGAAWFTRRGERVRRRAFFRYEDAADCDVRRVRTKLYGAAVSDSCVWRYKDARGRTLFALAAAWSPNKEPDPTSFAHFGLATHHAWQRFRSRGLLEALQRAGLDEDTMMVGGKLVPRPRVNAT
jgi:hypothetical protein